MIIKLRLGFLIFLFFKTNIVLCFGDTTSNRMSLTHQSILKQYYEPNADLSFLKSIVSSDESLLNSRIKYNMYLRLKYAKISDKYLESFSWDSCGTMYKYSLYGENRASYYLENRIKYSAIYFPTTANRHGRKTNAMDNINVHGIMNYEFLYRSLVDTPYNIKDLQVHIESLYYSLNVAHNVPIKVTIRSRQSNSYFFRKYIDFGIQFDNGINRRDIDAKLLDRYKTKLDNDFQIPIQSTAIGNLNTRLNDLGSWLANSDNKQRLSNEKEEYQVLLSKYQNIEQSLKQAINDTVSDNNFLNSRLYNGNKIVFDELLEKSVISPELNSERGRQFLIGLLKTATKLKDSLFVLTNYDGPVARETKDKQIMYDSINDVLQKVKSRYDSLNELIERKLKSFNNSIKGFDGIKQFDTFSDSSIFKSLNKRERFLMCLKQLSIGRTMLNYSELTVHGIAITGISAEYQNKMIAAFSAGRVDYNDREFSLRSRWQRPSQYLILAKIGTEYKPHKFLIFTIFEGRKNYYSQVSASSSNILSYRSTTLLGYSVSFNHQLNKNLSIIGEFAKSSAPYIAETEKQNSIKRAFSFVQRNNEAALLKLSFAHPGLQSYLEGSYKYIGLDFQSFSIFNRGSKQQIFNFKGKQYFFKRKLSLSAQIKTFEFGDPSIQTNIKANTVMQNYQATFRSRNLPALSMYYMPVAQFVKSTSGSITENVSYVFGINTLYNYRIGKKNLSASLFANIYNGSSNGSGIGSGRLYTITSTQSYMVGSLNTETTIQINKQYALRWFVLKQQISHDINSLFGYSADISCAKPALGSFKLGVAGGLKYSGINLVTLHAQFERNFIPSQLNRLSPVTWARLVCTTKF